ncbi:MAG: RNA polymerase sigma factor [Bacteroidota bacterium]
MNQSVNELIRLSKKSDQKAQLTLYDLYAPKMLGVCRQYISDLQFAEDVMLIGFQKTFQNLNKYKPIGSFEAWLRQIMVRECISYLRVQKNKFNVVEIFDYHFSNKVVEHYDDITADVQRAIDHLPVGCRTVFNLYVLEGYKHKEIAELLKISLGTSKSQLAHAKTLLKKQLAHLKSNYNGTR